MLKQLVLAHRLTPENQRLNDACRAGHAIADVLRQEAFRSDADGEAAQQQ